MQSDSTVAQGLAKVSYLINCYVAGVPVVIYPAELWKELQTWMTVAATI